MDCKDELSPLAVGTPRYRALIDDRRRELRVLLDRSLPSHGSFTWELGCGHGHFLTSYAAAHPEKWCVGVDVIGERIERALRKRDRAKLANLHFIQADAKLFLEILPPAVTCDEIFILFPDPWPKLRHHKHRIIQPGFLELAARHTAADCRLCFRTDFEPYFAAARPVVDAHPRWQCVDEPWPFEFETVFQQRASHYHSFVARRRP